MEKLKTFVIANQAVIIIVLTLGLITVGFKLFKDGKK